MVVLLFSSLEDVTAVESAGRGVPSTQWPEVRQGELDTMF